MGDDRSQPDLLLKTTLLLLAVALNAIEFFVPRIPFLPWLKPGLANIVTIIWIIRFGTLDALLFSLLRTWIVGFYLGFSFVTLALAMSGGIAATLAMGLCWHIVGRPRLLGVFGLGVIGALFHNAGQLAAVYLLMAHNLNIFYQTPFMIAASMVFGGSIGLLAVWAWPAYAHTDQTVHVRRSPAPSMSLFRGSDAAVSLVLFGCSIGVMLVKPPGWLAVCATSSTLLVQIVCGFSLKRLVAPVTRFWLLFLFIGAVYTFLSYGRSIWAIPFVTYEGAIETVRQWLRLWTWLQLSALLTRFRFHTIFMALLQWLFPRNRSTIEAAMLSLEHLPAVTDIVRSTVRLNPRQLVRAPVAELRSALLKIHGAIESYISEHLR